MLSSSPAYSESAWAEAASLFKRSQPVTLSMVALAATMPFYLYIGFLVQGGPVHVPALELDGMIPVEPAWAPVYLSLFLAALLPAFVLHQQELINRTVLAYLAAWLTAFAFFLAFPTIGSRPASIEANGFLAWMLRTIWASDHRFNCFPSLHVAQCFLAALACRRVHRGVGDAALVWASAVGLSTLYTKQHYVADVAGGIILALAAYLIFIRPYPAEAIPERERRLAPRLALGAVASYGILVGMLWVAYSLGVTI
jgi:membrane-associated phospholipid phosphatase